jgi:hypothetical protein
MKKTKNLLSCVFAAGMIVVVILVVLYESDILVSGMLAGAHQSEFLWTTLMELATLGCAFLALRLFKFDRVHRVLNEQKAVALKKWGLLRLLLLFLPLLTDTLLYYIYMNPTFGYLGIILALCLPFVYPSEGRCIAETEQ